MSYPKAPGDPEAHRDLAARHLVVCQALDLARAALAERDAALERIAERGCIYAESDLTCREREWPEDEWCASCIASDACIAAACLANRAGDGEGA